MIKNWQKYENKMVVETIRYYKVLKKDSITYYLSIKYPNSE